MILPPLAKTGTWLEVLPQVCPVSGSVPAQIVNLETINRLSADPQAAPTNMMAVFRAPPWECQLNVPPEATAQGEDLTQASRCGATFPHCVKLWTEIIGAVRGSKIG